MRVRTRVDSVYKFEELEDSIQQKVMEKIASENMEWFPVEDLTYQFEQVLEEYGFPTDDIEWRLSWSQGDGVAFYGTVNVYKYLTAMKQRTKWRILLKSGMYIDARFTRNSYSNFYSHFNTMGLDLEVEHSERELTALEVSTGERLRDQLIEDKREMCDRLERMGYAEFEWISSEEYIKEQIEANDYEFTWEGELV